MKKHQIKFYKKFLKIFFLFFIGTHSLFATKKNDSTLSKFDFYRIGIDLSKIVSSSLAKDYKAFEFTSDVHYQNDLYAVLDFGFGNSKVENKNLTYNSKNYFLRLGLDKTFFSKDFKGDMDNAFVGLRYGASFANRSSANYFIQDTIWGNSTGTIPASHFVIHWVELTGGFRVEVMKHIFFGWNIRVKTFLNPSKFKELPPNYIAGYGRGDKNTAFGYNFYLMYGLGKRR